MSTQLIKAEQRAVIPSHAETMEIAEVLAQSGAFPTVEKAAQAYAVIIIGQSFGMAPGEALMAISLVQGKPSFDVHWQAKRIIELGHHYEIVQLDGQKCTIRAWRLIHGQLKECGEATMTMDRAKQIKVYDKGQGSNATLGGKWNYRSWAEDMLYAYCMRRVVRRYFPEVLGGYGGGDDDTTLDAMADDGVIEGETTPLEELGDELFGKETNPTAHEPTTDEMIDDAIDAGQRAVSRHRTVRQHDPATDEEYDPETGEVIPPDVGVQEEMGLGPQVPESVRRTM